MKRRPQDQDKPSISVGSPQNGTDPAKIGIVLSGGCSRAAYQVGALKALLPYLGFKTSRINVIVGSSIGAVNGLVLAAGIKHGLPEVVAQMEALWKERTF